MVETFGSRVRRYRLARQMTQATLAQTVNRSHSMISAIEAGTRQVHVDELVTFADALKVSPSALLGSDDADHYSIGYQAGWLAARRVLLNALNDHEAEEQHG